jgi:hypothetical protein
VSAYKDALAIASDTNGTRRQLALDLLSSGENVVLLEGRLALRPSHEGILCEVITNLPPAARTPDALQAEIESAQALLATSTVGHQVQQSVLKWLVVEDYGTGTLQVWPLSV